MTLPQKGYLLSCFGLPVCISAVFLMEGRYYQDNVYHGMNLFFCDSMDFKWYLWSLVPGVYDSLCGQKNAGGSGIWFLGCLPVAATCLLPMGTRVECGSDDVDRSLFCPVPRDYLVFVLIR